MSAIRVIFFLLALTAILTVIARYIVLFLYKLKFVEERMMKKAVKKSKIAKDIKKHNKK